MSADNGIYIAKFNDGFRVCHAQAIENISEYAVGSQYWKDEFIDFFGGSKVFTTLDEAYSEGNTLNPDDTEYGMSNLGDFSAYEIFDKNLHYRITREDLLQLGFSYKTKDNDYSLLLTTPDFVFEAFFGIKENLLEFIVKSKNDSKDTGHELFFQTLEDIKGYISAEKVFYFMEDYFDKKYSISEEQEQEVKEYQDLIGY